MVCDYTDDFAGLSFLCWPQAVSRRGDTLHLCLLRRHGRKEDDGNSPHEEHTKSGPRCRSVFYSANRRNRRALVMTDTELNVIAAAAIIGLRRSPKNG